MVKKYLDAKSHKYDVVNLDEQPERRGRKLMPLSGSPNRCLLPLLPNEDDSKEVVVGYNLSKLAPA